MLRIAYCGYDYYSNCLAALLAQDDVQVLKVFACGNKRLSHTVIMLAKQYHVPWQLERISDEDVTRLFAEQRCDYIISAAYVFKIPIGRHRGLNIHPTLPRVERVAVYHNDEKADSEGRETTGVESRSVCT